MYALRCSAQNRVVSALNGSCSADERVTGLVTHKVGMDCEYTQDGETGCCTVQMTYEGYDGLVERGRGIFIARV